MFGISESEAIKVLQAEDFDFDKSVNRLHKNKEKEEKKLKEKEEKKLKDKEDKDKKEKEDREKDNRMKE
jgi:elongation factor 1 alpha-like protein